MSIRLANGARIGEDASVFVIAEAGVNHNGHVGLARRLVDAAAAAGADAVKFQTFRAERVVSRSAPKAEYQTRTTDGGESQQEMLRKLELSPQAHGELIAHCAERGILFLSTPFDEDAADLLESLDVAAFKLPSGEVTNLPFLAHVARKRRPILLSTGMSSLDEVATAVETIRAAGGEDLVLLHCVSSYPADPASTNLRAMETMRAAFGVPVGYSDHTGGIEIPIAAAALGACVIEKHFTVDRTLPGPDHQASLEPDELAAMVRGIRKAEAALGDGVKRPTDVELSNRDVIRRSLHLRAPVAAGGALEADMLIALRPAGGIPPAELERLVGRRAARDLEAGARLAWEDLA